MSSTNKTTHYELSQFLGTDKPAWLNDYNADMSKIDAGINTAQSTATSADGKATTNATSIGTLANLATTEKTNLVGAINEVNTTAGTAQGTATGASDTANTAIGKVNDLTSYLTIAYFTNLTATISGSGSPSITSQNVKSAYNNTGSLGKVYGRIDFSKTGVSSNITISLGDTGLRPTTAITINSAATFSPYDNTYHLTGLKSADLVINTDGTASLSFSMLSSEIGGQIILTPFVIFAQDFGD